MHLGHLHRTATFYAFKPSKFSGSPSWRTRSSLSMPCNIDFHSILPYDEEVITWRRDILEARRCFFHPLHFCDTNKFDDQWGLIGWYDEAERHSKSFVCKDELSKELLQLLCRIVVVIVGITWWIRLHFLYGRARPAALPTFHWHQESWLTSCQSINECLRR